MTLIHQEPPLDEALTQLLRPVVRLLLRQGMAFGAFALLVKRVYVEVATSEFGLGGKKASLSRVSILSGLTRKEVRRLSDEPAQHVAAEPGPGARFNRAARVLSGWVRDADFGAGASSPRPLEIDGSLGFATLVRRHSGDMPARAVLDELLRVGAVRQLKDGRVELVERAYVPRDGDDEKLRILGTDVAELVSTIDHNLRKDSGTPRFQRKLSYQGVPTQTVHAFRQLSAAQAQALLENLDSWLARHIAGSRGKDLQRSRVSLGIYYYEEPQSTAEPERVSK